MLEPVMIGHGAIACYVAQQLKAEDRITLRHVLCRPGREQAATDALGRDVTVHSAVATIKGPLAVALDCGGHAALRAHGPALLRRGTDVLTVSTGALTDPSLVEKLTEAAISGGARLRLLSGAIGGLDALAAARIGGLDSVRYTGRKPPEGWKGSPAEDSLDLSRLTQAATHFEGSAREAASRYPKNANVAATVALAGIGMDETRVRLIADPTVDRNRHEIEASGAFGTLSLVIEGNTLPGNPRSSALTAMSAVAALRDYVEPLVV